VCSFLLNAGTTSRHQPRGAPGRALNGDAGRVVQFLTALSSNQPRTPGFQSGNTGASPVEAATWFEPAPALDPRPESASPHRISAEASRRPEPAGANFCARGVTATRRSASLRRAKRLRRLPSVALAKEVHYPAGAQSYGRQASRLDRTRRVRLRRAHSFHRVVVSTAAQRIFTPHGVGATPAGPISICHPSAIEGGRRRSLPAPSDLELRADFFARWEKSDPPACKAV
jgi:hypothetical protein